MYHVCLPTSPAIAVSTKRTHLGSLHPIESHSNIFIHELFLGSLGSVLLQPLTALIHDACSITLRKEKKSGEIWKAYESFVVEI